MKSITLSYTVPKTITINVKELPWKYKKWLEAVFTDEDNRTDTQWDLAEENNFYPEIIREVTGDIIDPYEDIDIEDYED